MTKDTNRKDGDSYDSGVHAICQSCGLCRCSHERGFWTDAKGVQHEIPCKDALYTNKEN